MLNSLLRPRFWLFLIIFACAGLVLVSVYLRLTNNSNRDELVIDDFARTLVGTNDVVFESNGLTRREGSFIPNDTNLAQILPSMPPTSKLLNVTDSMQVDKRIVTLEYEILRDENSSRDLALSELGRKGWVEIVENSDQSITAKRENTEVLVTIKGIDNLSSLVSFVVTIRN